MNFDGLVTRLQSLFDVGQTRAVDVANERLAEMVTRSTALRSVRSLGSTVAGQASYTLNENIVKILQIEVAYTAGTKAYNGVATLEDLWAVARHEAEVDPDFDGVVAIEADSDSTMTTDNFRMYPAPGESGKAITGLVAIRPAAITYGSSTALPIPVDLHPKLLAGCKAELFEEEGNPTEAATNQAEFEQGIRLLEASVNKRGKSSGGTRLRVSGYDFARG